MSFSQVGVTPKAGGGFAPSWENLNFASGEFLLLFGLKKIIYSQESSAAIEERIKTRQFEEKQV